MSPNRQRAKRPQSTRWLVWAEGRRARRNHLGDSRGARRDGHDVERLVAGRHEFCGGFPASAAYVCRY